MHSPLTLSDFDYLLPDTLIAQTPAPARGASRLLRLGPDGTEDCAFSDLFKFLKPGDVLVFNDTKVIKARLFGEKPTGGQIEILVERVLDTQHVLAQLRVSKKPQPGSTIRIAEAFDATVIERKGEFFQLRFEGDIPVLTLLERYGALPLPPYIEHAADITDETRYQTVYANKSGAVAAPTAGLHFDTDFLEKLQATGVKLAFITLHVGAGTFQPVRVENLLEHTMHSEWYDIPAETVHTIENARAAGNRIVAVGTTTLRTLEASATANHGRVTAGSAETSIFITPGYGFKIVDRLITNFHLPKSTLLMLVSAFAGIEPVRRAYAHAIAQRYRFFSYGDAMLIDRSKIAQ